MWKRLTVIWAALRGDLKLLWAALRHPQSPAWLKAGTALLVLYLFMPIDFLPDFIPFCGRAGRRAHHHLGREMAVEKNA
jgi:uncharacterized membrane protein YkvA (DUF1232 family)